MIRREQVHPNENGEVTLEALIEAAIRGCTTLDFAGGCLSIVVDRAPTGFPGEMFTTKAAMEWRHDARVQPRPEQFEQPTQEPERGIADVVRNGEVVNTVSVEMTETGYPIPETAEPLPEAEASDAENPDGFDYSRLDEEDVEEPVATS
jgi:hypothetical protein